MKVTVKHLAKLKREGDKDFIEVDLASEATVIDLLSQLGIDQNDVGVLVVDGTQATFDQKLKDHSIVTIIPNIGGG
ncbi:MAG: MoaD/ThiS family protein [Desulfatiglandaceae bacterium]